MDNFEDKIKHNSNSAGESCQNGSDPIIQARDNSSKTNKKLQHTDIIHSAKEPFSVTDTTLLPQQFMRTEPPLQSPLSANNTNIIEMMLRFKWMILVIFVLVAAPSIAFIWTQIVPQYRARAAVRVQPIIPHLVFRTEDNGMIPLYDSFVNTQISIMTSMTVLQRVLDQPEVQKTQWYNNPRKSLKQRLLRNPVVPPLERLGDALKIRNRARTEIIDVTLTNDSKQDARIIVDAVLEQYIQYIGETSDKTKDNLYAKLVEQSNKFGTEISGREKIITELRKTLGTSNPQELISGRRFRLDETQARLSDLRQTIAVLEWELKQSDNLDSNIDNNDSNTDNNDSNDVPDASVAEIEKQKQYYEDREWQNRDINVRTIQHQIATSLLTRKHQDRAKAEMDLKFAKELLRLRETQLDEQWSKQQKNNTFKQKNSTSVMPIITNAGGSGYKESSASLKFQLDRAKQEEIHLEAELKKQQADFNQLSETAQMLEKENNALQHKRTLFQAVQQRLDQKNMERNVSGTIKVLSPAFVPFQPHSDRRIVFTLMTLVLGLGLGGSAAFLKATVSQTIYTNKDIPYPMQVPFLGYIPANRTRKSPNEEFNPAMIESIRVVRTALLSRLNGQVNTTVLVTSADAATGKSTFTMMLGKSLAQAGKKVLIIDADFRKITLTKRFNLLGKTGFLESLSHKSVDKRHIFPTETFGLSIMPAGKRTNNGMVFEETANGAFKACIGQLRNQFNIILLDSSPILPVADATILSSQVDGTIMVERELVSRRANVINALARLGSAGGRILGTVFVGSDNNENYGYNYSYSRTDES
jgi:capsular exopolysaccharide synthesis family protein